MTSLAEGWVEVRSSQRGWPVSDVLRRSNLLCLLAGIVAAFSVLGNLSVAEAAGSLDPTFGTDGVAISSLGVAGEGSGVELGLAPEGSVVVANGVGGRILRLLPDGSPDESFGDGGELRVGPETLPVVPADQEFFPRQIAVDGLGRILVFGEDEDNERAPTAEAGRHRDGSSVAVLRLETDGLPDLTFGSGTGFASYNFGLAATAPSENVLEAAVDSRNRPIVVVGVQSPPSRCALGHSVLEARPRAVVRLSEAGLPDRSYGGGDGVSGPISASDGFSTRLGLDASGRVTIGVGRIGSGRAGCESGTAVYRLRRSGGRDKGFGSGGIYTSRRFELAAVEPSGALILSRESTLTLTIARVSPGGRSDMSFGRRGLVRVHLPVRVGLHVQPLAIDARGRILLTGFVGSPIGSPSKGQPRSALVVARLLPDGRPDPSFGRDGWIFTHPPGRPEVTAAQATFDRQGRLILAGSVLSKPDRIRGFVVARYLVGG